MPEGSLWKIILMVVCVFFSGFFSATETAFTSFNHTKMKNLASEGNKKAKLVLKLSDKYDKLLSTILIGNNIVNITLSSVATVWFIQLLVNTNAADYGSVIATAVTTVVVLIFGEISPKSIAKEHPEGFVMAVCRFVNFLVVFLTPINAIFMLWKKFLNLIFKPAAEEAVTEGEVLTLLDEAHEDGSIDEYNKEMIENIFDFDDISAGEIATHRTEITMLAKDDPLEEWETVVNNSRFSRYPVYGEDVDDIIGVLDAREYFRLENRTKENILENAVKPAYFVPESVKADILFRNMKKNKESFAIVLDEYGGVRGIITFTDLVECLVGEFTETDEDEEQVEPIIRLDDTRWQINGTVTISDLEEALGVELSDCDSDTFNGFAMGLYGSIPEDGSTFQVSNDLMDIEVLDIREHKIESAIITLKTPAEGEDEEEEEKSKSVKSESAL
ncbi:MAG: HlyC/CorC family transporter [Clostridia bacterium]|nr:HlyC/CorC family transporter [Clostridia bacterium]